jgi:hypothetical protein
MNASQVKSAFNTAVTTLGNKAVFTRNVDDTTYDIYCSVSPLGEQDNELVNVYGVHAKRLTFTVPTKNSVPAKFDWITIDNKKFVIAGVVPVLALGETIGFRAYAEGDA